MDTPSLSQRVREMLAAGQPVEDAIVLLRDAGCSKGQSVLVLADATSMDMSAAVQAVNDSHAWSGQRESDAAMNNALWDRLEREGDVQADGSVDITRWLNAEPKEGP